MRPKLEGDSSLPFLRSQTSAPVQRASLRLALITMAPKRKRTAKDLAEAWPGPQLKIFKGTEPSHRICRIPISFLQSCGVPDLRSVVRGIAEATFVEAAQLRDADGQLLEDVDVLTVDSLFLHPMDPTGTLTAIELTQGKSRFRPVNLSRSESTFSDSTHATGRPDQVSICSSIEPELADSPRVFRPPSNSR